MTFHLLNNEYWKQYCQIVDIPKNIRLLIQRSNPIQDQTTINQLPQLPERILQNITSEEEDKSNLLEWLNVLHTQHNVIALELVTAIQALYDTECVSVDDKTKALACHKLNAICNYVLGWLCMHATRDIVGLKDRVYSDGTPVYTLSYPDDRPFLLHELQIHTDELRLSFLADDSKEHDFFCRVSKAVGIYTILFNYNIPRTKAAGCLTPNKLTGSKTDFKRTQGIFVINPDDPLYEWLWSKLMQVIVIGDRLHGKKFYTLLNSKGHPVLNNWYGDITGKLDGKKTKNRRLKSSRILTPDDEYFIKSIDMGISCFQRYIANDEWTAIAGRPGSVEFLYPTENSSELILGGRAILTSTGNVRPIRLVENRTRNPLGERRLDDMDIALLTQHVDNANYTLFNYAPSEQGYDRNGLMHKNLGTQPPKYVIGSGKNYGLNPNSTQTRVRNLPPVPTLRRCVNIINEFYKDKKLTEILRFIDDQIGQGNHTSELQLSRIRFESEHLNERAKGTNPDLSDIIQKLQAMVSLPQFDPSHGTGFFDFQEALEFVTMTALVVVHKGLNRHSYSTLNLALNVWEGLVTKFGSRFRVHQNDDGDINILLREKVMFYRDLVTIDQHLVNDEFAKAERLAHKLYEKYSWQDMKGFRDDVHRMMKILFKDVRELVQSAQTAAKRKPFPVDQIYQIICEIHDSPHFKKGGYANRMVRFERYARPTSTIMWSLVREGTELGQYETVRNVLDKLNCYTQDNRFPNTTRLKIGFWRKLTIVAEHVSNSRFAEALHLSNTLYNVHGTKPELTVDIQILQSYRMRPEVQNINNNNNGASDGFFSWSSLPRRLFGSNSSGRTPSNTTPVVQPVTPSTIAAMGNYLKRTLSFGRDAVDPSVAKRHRS